MGEKNKHTILVEIYEKKPGRAKYGWGIILKCILKINFTAA
jgi:hypothetical protein